MATRLAYRFRAPTALAACSLAAAAALCGCGLNIEAPDLFLLTRTGSGQKQTLLVNSGGTIKCDGSQSKPLPDTLLLKARNLTGSLNTDAKHHLHIAPGPGSVYSYSVKLQDGTITFPDIAARAHPELAQLELLAVQILSGPCHGLSHSG